jgi:hypothetical protein
MRNARDEVSVEYEGQTYSAMWHVEGGMLEVSSPDLGSKVAKAGAAPERMASRLLKELLREAAREGLLQRQPPMKP